VWDDPIRELRRIPPLPTDPALPAAPDKTQSEPQSADTCFQVLPEVAKSPYISRFHCWWLPAVSACCALGGVSSGVNQSGHQRWHCELERLLRTAFSSTLSRRTNNETRGKSKDEQRAPGASKPSFLAEEPRLPLPFCARRPVSRFPRLVLLVEPAVDEGPDQGAGRDTASEALAAEARVDPFFEAHRDRLSQGSHLRPQPYTSRPPPATDCSTVVLERRRPRSLQPRQHERRKHLPMQRKHRLQTGAAAYYLRGSWPQYISEWGATTRAQ